MNSHRSSRIAHQQITQSPNRTRPQLCKISHTRRRLRQVNRRWVGLVGDTPLLCAPELARQYGLPNLYLKLEGANPSGSQKDRVALRSVQDALLRGFSTITVATCGNYGAALALFARSAQLGVQIVIPESFNTPRIAEIAAHGATIIRYPGSYEECVGYSTALAKSAGWYDANPGGAHVSLQMAAYTEVAQELLMQLNNQPPAIVALPVSNGTTVAGVHQGFVALNQLGRIPTLPKVIAGSSGGMNPIVDSILEGRLQYTPLPPEVIHETEVNEPLINAHSFEGAEAFDAICESGGGAAWVSDAELVAAAADIRRLYGLNYLPAALAGVVALRKVGPKGDGPLVALLTCATAMSAPNVG